MCPDRETKKQRGSVKNEETAKIEEINFPKNWKKLSTEEQKDWIASYYMLKTRIPEPVLKRKDRIAKGQIRLESGAKIKFPATPVTTSKRNPNIIRELEGWIGKWLITVFYDRKLPHVKFFGIANPSRDKWIAQELSSEICNRFYAVIMKIRWKYGFFKGKKRKKRRKKSISTLSLKDSNTRRSSR